MMQVYSVYKGGNLIADEVHKADRFFSRFMGLMFKKKMDVRQGLWILPCNQVHTFNMRFDIDVIFMSDDFKVLYIVHGMKPHRVSKMIARSRCVLELCAGEVADCGIELGDTLSFCLKHS